MSGTPEGGSRDPPGDTEDSKASFLSATLMSSTWPLGYVQLHAVRPLTFRRRLLYAWPSLMGPLPAGLACEQGHPVVGWLGLRPLYAFNAVPQSLHLRPSQWLPGAWLDERGLEKRILG